MIWVILVVSLILRIVNLSQSLWLDEAIGALAVRDFTYLGILTDFLKSDNHPPLYYLDLKAWTGIFGYSEVALRLHSVLYGVLTVYITYLIAKKIFPSHKPPTRTFYAKTFRTRWITNRFAFLPSLLLATSPFHIYYSQEARMYSMAAFFSSLAIYAFLLLIGEAKIKREYWILFSFAITALVFTDYVPIFLLPVFWVVAWLKEKKGQWWMRFLLTHAPLTVLGLFWLPTFLIQAQKGGWLLANLPAWKDVAGGASLKQAALVWMKFVFGRISLKDKIFYYSLVVTASIPFLVSIYNSWKQRFKKLDIIWLWLVLPLVLGFLISFWFPAFIYFRFLYVVPAFYLIVAWGAWRIRSRKARTLLIPSLFLVNITGWLIYVGEPYQQREQWRQATEFVEERVAGDEVVIFEFPEPFAPYRWYARGKAEAVGVTNSISVERDETVDIVKKTISDKSGIYYFEYLNELSDPEGVVKKTISEEGFRKVEVFDFPGVGFVEYWRI